MFRFPAQPTTELAVARALNNSRFCFPPKRGLLPSRYYESIGRFACAKHESVLHKYSFCGIFHANIPIFTVDFVAGNFQGSGVVLGI